MLQVYIGNTIHYIFLLIIVIISLLCIVDISNVIKRFTFNKKNKVEQHISEEIR